MKWIVHVSNNYSYRFMATLNLFTWYHRIMTSKNFKEHYVIKHIYIFIKFLPRFCRITQNLYRKLFCKHSHKMCIKWVVFEAIL